jgi:hypothetical protein
MTDRLMPAEHVVEVYDLLAGHGIGVWVDGGWESMRSWKGKPGSMEIWT